MTQSQQRQDDPGTKQEGFYGSSRDQWASGLNDGRDHADDPQEASLPASVSKPPATGGLYRAQFDSEPYRRERVYAGTNEMVDPLVTAVSSTEAGCTDTAADAPAQDVGPYDPQPASNPYEQGRHDLAMRPPELEPDEQLQVSLTERLASVGAFDGCEITVRVCRGVVTLCGVVTEAGMKDAIEDIATGHAGVNRVENRVRVHRYDSAANGLATADDDSKVLHGRQM